MRATRDVVSLRNVANGRVPTEVCRVNLMSRRTFMELLTAVTAAHVAAGPAEAEGLPQEGSGRRRAEGRCVVVLGAGLAGLATRTT